MKDIRKITLKKYIKSLTDTFAQTLPLIITFPNTVNNDFFMHKILKLHVFSCPMYLIYQVSFVLPTQSTKKTKDKKDFES